MDGHRSAGVDGLHHVSIRVRDMDRSIGFYRDVLGCAVRTAFELHDLRFAMLAAGDGRYVELVETRTDPRTATEADVFWHLAFRTRDIERSLEAVRAAGFEILRPVTPLDLFNEAAGKPFPVRVAFFRGPDGEEIELIEDETGQT